jgi:hypothetical protein
MHPGKSKAVGLSACPAQSALDRSNEIAANWLREHAADIPSSTPQITEGEVLITTSG